VVTKSYDRGLCLLVTKIRDCISATPS